jgi:hypothetical protein
MTPARKKSQLQKIKKILSISAFGLKGDNNKHIVASIFSQQQQTTTAKLSQKL